MKKHLKLIFTFMILSLNSVNAEVLNLTSQELLDAQKQGVVIIDIRTPEEWIEVGTIPNSTRIMFYDQKRKPLANEFMQEFQKIVTKKDQPFILVCRTGSRTGRVTKFLDQQGYTHGAHLRNGIKQWIKEGRKVVK
jgi:rhodanese-related sulfurtransferase